MAVVALVGPFAASTLAVPLGLPGAGVVLALDGLSAFFLLLLFLAGTAASVAAFADHHPTAPFLPAFVAGMALTVLAGDAFALVAGFEVMSLASFALVLTHHREPGVREAALLYLGMAQLGAVCLIAAFALLGYGGAAGVWEMSFTTLRAHPPAGWKATAVLVLVVVGAGSKAGLVPLHVWLPPAHAAAPGYASALMSGAMTKVALYVMVRVMFDLCGPAQPLWWGLPLLVLGAAGAVLGALRASMETDLKTVLACSTVENIGIVCIGLGLALAARAADLPALAALAMGGALLHALAHSQFKSLMFLAAGAVQHGAGTRKLALLGGLIQSMPITTACVLMGAACLASLPPTAGFAGEWTLLQALLAAPRIGGLAFQTTICVAAALLAFAAALAASAMVRLVGVAFLGRPRSPRASAADDAPPTMRWAMLGLAASCLVIGLLPGLVLRLASPALHLMVSADLGDHAGLLRVLPSTDGSAYAAPAIAALLVAASGCVWWLIRARSVAGHRVVPAWDCGFGAPPPWLPFGDPATQYGADSFAQPLRRVVGTALLAARDTINMPETGEMSEAGDLHRPACTSPGRTRPTHSCSARWPPSARGFRSMPMRCSSSPSVALCR